MLQSSPHHYCQNPDLPPYLTQNLHSVTNYRDYFTLLAFVSYHMPPLLTCQLFTQHFYPLLELALQCCQASESVFCFIANIAADLRPITQQILLSTSLFDKVISSQASDIACWLCCNLLEWTGLLTQEQVQLLVDYVAVPTLPSEDACLLIQKVFSSGKQYSIPTKARTQLIEVVRSRKSVPAMRALANIY